jgi:hypothetical protein
MVTGATYFGFIESSKDWLEGEHPNLAGPWAHFLAGATGDTLGSIVYVPCEVLKQRMQVSLILFPLLLFLILVSVFASL